MITATAKRIVKRTPLVVSTVPPCTHPEDKRLVYYQEGVEVVNGIPVDGFIRHVKCLECLQEITQWQPVL